VSGEAMTHLNVGLRGVPTWLDKVTDEDYAGRAVARRPSASR